VVEHGLAVTVLPVTALNPVEGLQDTDMPFALPAVSVVLSHTPMVGRLAVTVMLGITTTVTDLVYEQLFCGQLNVAVYVVVWQGRAVTLFPVVELRPVEGDHVTLIPGAPLAVSVELPHSLILCGLADIVPCCTLTVTVAVLLVQVYITQPLAL
jgi:hypothetical protein